MLTMPLPVAAYLRFAFGGTSYFSLDLILDISESFKDMFGYEGVIL